jgi:hypothetical protein
MENLNRIKRNVLRQIEENISQVETAHKLHDFVNEIIEKVAKKKPGYTKMPFRSWRIYNCTAGRILITHSQLM